jgi:FtsP/CotA-like multicopper oxidase with cupredoxin domain
MKFQKNLLALAGVVLALLQPAYARRPLKVFDLTLTWEKYAPDGFARQMILINGQFPGPLIEVNQGDAVEIRVRNRLPVNTTVHYHGKLSNSACRCANGPMI